MVERRVHGGNIREFARKQGILPNQVVDFSTNVNFLGPPVNVLDAIGNNLDSVRHYPDCRQEELREALAKYLTVPKENILVGNGSADLIFLLCRYLKARKTLILAPTFSEYEIALESVGGEAIYLDMRSGERFIFSLPKAMAAINKVDLVFICNPNNPTGTLIPPEEIQELVNCKITVIVDEAFIDFVDSYNSLRQEAAKLNNLIVLGSLTKFFAIPGLRLGYIIADPITIEELSALRDPWSINCFAQIAGKEVLKNQRYFSRSRKEICKNRQYLIEQLNSLGGFKPYQSVANFVLVKITHRGLDSCHLQEELAPYGILIRNCDSFRGLDNRYIRLAVRSRRDTDYLISTISKIFDHTRVKASHQRS